MAVKRGSITLAVLAMLGLAGSGSPAGALPFAIEDILRPVVEQAQYNQVPSGVPMMRVQPRLGTQTPRLSAPRGEVRVPRGEVRVPRGRVGGGGFRGGGGLVIVPGLLLPPLIDAIQQPRNRRVIIEEVDEDEPVARPRQRARRKQPEARPAARRQPPRQPPRQQAQPTAPRLPPVSIPVAGERRLVSDEVLIELRTGADNAAVMRRHRLTPLETRRFSLANATIIRARVEGGRSARQALQQMAGDARIASAQPNYLYALQEEPGREAKQTPKDGGTPTPAEARKADVPDQPGSPATAPGQPVPEPPPVPKPQYALERMAIPEAHRLAQGAKVRIALIDTGLDDTHPELQGVIAGRFDALGTDATGTLAHGTALAGVIVAKATLRGVSPAAELLAARAFGAAAGAASQGTSFQILQAMDWAAEQGARVFNLSFAGPRDRLMGRTLEGARARRIIAVAAVGNAGPGTPALYPAAEPSVLAVTATDASDAVFNRANTGREVAIAAPGVDIIAAAPEKRYAFSSGTSVAAAHVSGLVALMLERNPALDLAGVRRVLGATAQDLGARGLDPVFGAGRVNAAAAVARAAEEAAPKN